MYTDQGDSSGNIDEIIVSRRFISVVLSLYNDASSRQIDISANLMKVKLHRRLLGTCMLDLCFRNSLTLAVDQTLVSLRLV